MESEKQLATLETDTLVQMAGILKAVIESRGQGVTELEGILPILEVKLPHKLDSYNRVIESCLLQSEGFKEKKEFYADLEKGCKAVAERLKMNVRFAMEQLQTDELCGADIRFKLSRTKPALVLDEAQLDPAYKMQVTEVVPDKERIRLALELGESVPGAQLKESFSLRTYANSPITKKKGKAS